MTTGRINQVTAFFLFPRISLIPFFALPLLIALCLLPREKESEKRRGRTKKEEGKNALQRLPSGRGFFYPVKEVQKKPFLG
jgi:hypothetical protein